MGVSPSRTQTLYHHSSRRRRRVLPFADDDDDDFDDDVKDGVKDGVNRKEKAASHKRAARWEPNVVLGRAAAVKRLRTRQLLKLAAPQCMAFLTRSGPVTALRWPHGVAADAQALAQALRCKLPSPVNFHHRGTVHARAEANEGAVPVGIIPGGFAGRYVGAVYLVLRMPERGGLVLAHVPTVSGSGPTPTPPSTPSTPSTSRSATAASLRLLHHHRYRRQLFQDVSIDNHVGDGTLIFVAAPWYLFTTNCEEATTALVAAILRH